MDCTECEHYRPMSSDGYSSDIKVCRDIFTPKKPEPERKCTNCDGYSRDNCIGLYGIDGCSGQAYKHWRPIPEEPESPEEYYRKIQEELRPIERVCSTCGADGSSIFNEPCYSCLSGSSYRNWRPKLKLTDGLVGAWGLNEKPLIIKKSDLDPGDVIVLETDNALSEQATINMKESLKPLWPDNEVLVLEEGMRVARAKGQTVPDKPTPPLPEKSCKECAHSGPSRSRNWPGEIYCDYYHKNYGYNKWISNANGLCFVPKKPEPDKPEKSGSNTCKFGNIKCRYNGDVVYCKTCLGNLYEPKDKSVESDPGIGQSYWTGGTLSDCQTTTITKEQYERFNHQQKTPNRKETSMWNKVVHLIRMSVLVLCLVGMFTVGSFVNPKLIWVADVVRPLGDKAVQLESGETVMMKMSYGDHFLAMPGSDMFSVWLVFALAIATAIVIPYLLHIATLKLFNVRKKV